MRDLPTLATEDQLQEMLNVSRQTFDSWRRRGLEPVGNYLPPGRTRPLALYQVRKARQLHRLSMASADTG